MRSFLDSPFHMDLFLLEASPKITAQLACASPLLYSIPVVPQALDRHAPIRSPGHISRGLKWT